MTRSKTVIYIKQEKSVFHLGVAFRSTCWTWLHRHEWSSLPPLPIQLHNITHTGIR